MRYKLHYQATLTTNDPAIYKVPSKDEILDGISIDLGNQDDGDFPAVIDTILGNHKVTHDQDAYGRIISALKFDFYVEAVDAGHVDANKEDLEEEVNEAIFFFISSWPAFHVEVDLEFLGFYSITQK
jgi:hypothetical protein